MTVPTRRIGVIRGDGIGPEIVESALTVLNALTARAGLPGSPSRISKRVRDTTKRRVAASSRATWRGSSRASSMRC